MELNHGRVFLAGTIGFTMPDFAWGQPGFLAELDEEISVEFGVGRFEMWEMMGSVTILSCGLSFLGEEAEPSTADHG